MGDGSASLRIVSDKGDYQYQTYSMRWRWSRPGKTPYALLLTQWDYLRLGVLARHADGERGAVQYYRAMARLFALQDVPRPATANTREYLQQIGRRHRDLHKKAAEMTWLFEQARYGSKPLGIDRIERMRALYRELYRRL